MSLWGLWRSADAAMLARQRAFYQRLGKVGGLAFDIGANEGFVSEALLDAGLEVVAVEPDERNIRVLEARFGRNGAFHLFKGAVGEDDRARRMFVQEGGSALSTMSEKWRGLVERGEGRLHDVYSESAEVVAMTTLDALIGQYGSPGLVKIDVEGYEEAVMRGLSHKVPLLVFEANLPEFMDETVRCLRRLHAIDAGVRFGYAHDFRVVVEAEMGLDAFLSVLARVEESSIDVIACF